MTYRCQLAFSRTLGKPCTFFWIAAIETIRCRIKVANGEEVSPVDVHLRFRGRTKGPGLVHVRPIDESTFLTESAVLHEDLPYRMELLLVCVPEAVAAQIRSI